MPGARFGSTVVDSWIHASALEELVETVCLPVENVVRRQRHRPIFEAMWMTISMHDVCWEQLIHRAKIVDAVCLGEDGHLAQKLVPGKGAQEHERDERRDRSETDQNRPSTTGGTALALLNGGQSSCLAPVSVP